MEPASGALTGRRGPRATLVLGAIALLAPPLAPRTAVPADFAARIPLVASARMPFLASARVPVDPAPRVPVDRAPRVPVDRAPPAPSDLPALPDSIALADSLDLARVRALADSLARADTLGVEDSLALRDTLAIRAAVAPATALRTLRLDLGASSDVTNELFYEDQFDTTFRVVGRSSVESPETRVAAVMSAALEGARPDGRARYSFHDDFSLGDKVQREAADLYWRTALAPSWTLLLTPRAEARHDRSFDRDLWEWRAAPAARLRRELGGVDSDAELGLAGEVLRAAGSGSELVLDRDALAGTLAFERWGIAREWRVGYGLATRSFPDSTERDHREHSLEAQWRMLSAAGHRLLLEVLADRRHTVRPASTTRDDLYEERGAVELETRASEAWSLVARFEGEGVQYDRPDSVLYFDQTIGRALLAPRWRPGPTSTLEAGPRAEIFRSPLALAEEYRELAGVFEVEIFGPGSWWRLATAAGRRSYLRPALRHGFDPVGLHTDFTFVDLDLLVDRALAASLRLRALLTARLEHHTDSGDDSRSLYFSLDLRRLLLR